jgi:DNA-binding NarL/FixJ family response regulator
LNIAVVDDEEIIRQQIHGFIKKQKPESEISDFSTGEGLLAAKADFDIDPVRDKALSGHNLLEQGKEQPDHFRKTGQQLTGAYGGDGTCLLRDTGDEA